MAAFVLLFFSCAGDPGFRDYREGLFYGSKALENGDYRSALDQFLKAGRGEPDKPLPFALAGQAAYQLGDLASASRYLAQAERVDPKEQTEAYVIIKGYQALIAFREDRVSDGMATLGEYLKFYRHSYPDSTYDEVKRMYESGNINRASLELLIDHQMTRYEKEIFLIFY
jgi:tetratricopeptide (TPR) repeat protein